MWEYSDEARFYASIASIDSMMDENTEEVQEIRRSYAHIAQRLIDARDKAWRWNTWRECSVALTLIEQACMHEVKAFFAK